MLSLLALVGRMSSVLEFEGSGVFRHHLACALLSNRPVQLRGINADTQQAGLRDFEVNFLKFVDRATAGTKIEVTNGQADVRVTPGLLLGGTFSHAVPASRSVTYIIEAALLFLPFAKHPSEITFTGCTQHDLDLSVDAIRTVTSRWMKLFGVDIALRIVRRGAPPNGNGCVVLTVGNVRRLRAATAVERGKVRRVRGIAYSSNVSADLVKQCSSEAKSVLLNFLPDVYVVADTYTSPSGQQTIGTNGYGIMLVAESTSNTCVLSQEAVATAGEKPQAVGTAVAERLLDQVAEGGCVDAHHQMTVLLLMALAPDDVSTVRFGSLTPSAITAMSLMESFFGVTCAIKEEHNAYGIDEAPPSAVVSCLGCNTINFAKRSG